ncbi:hypothetical protein ED733_003038 [Metarhizium rileyi]|uniref:Chitinase n=1 Tax=Metarhizium rileyi (strain RCEF 4871) TaxID=1649241 RepID=A0A5C6G147_METRR|nr:hypothetical protein ED733_003038 [Metarhizium rileyi]
MVYKGVTDTIFSGHGFATYYYDIENVKACGTDFVNQNQGYVACSPGTARSLNQIGTNYLVAMNNTELQKNRKKYCGKRVIVTVNGEKSTLPFFIGDGCERCGGGPLTGPWNPVGAPGLDFSYSALSELSTQACSAGHIELSWEIADEALFQFNTDY